MQPWKHILRKVPDLFIPPVCLSCHSRIKRSEYPLCEPCLEAITVLEDEGLCAVCGSPMVDNTCEVCWENTIYFDLGRSVFRFDGAIQQLIHALKYNGSTAVAKWFARRAAEFVRMHQHFGGIDLIMAVPLHRVRRRERGYNQSDLIAKQLARFLGIAYCEPVFRKHYTLSQTRLSKQERLKNLKAAFGLKPNLDLTGKKILLVDDVFTTGSTVNEISKALRAANPAEIRVLAMARA